MNSQTRPIQGGSVPCQNDYSTPTFPFRNTGGTFARLPLSHISERKKYKNDMTGRTTAFRNKTEQEPRYDMICFYAESSVGGQVNSSGGCALRPMSPPVWGHNKSCFFFLSRCRVRCGAGLNVVPGNVNGHTRTRCPDAVLLQIRQASHVPQPPPGRTLSRGLDTPFNCLFPQSVSIRWRDGHVPECANAT